MNQPIYRNARRLGRVYIDQFGGVNKTESIGENEFVDMENMSSERYPYLCPCRARKQVVKLSTLSSGSEISLNAMIAPKLEPGTGLDSFTGVANVGGTPKFYYKGVEKSGVIDTTYNQYITRRMVDFNGTILVFPDKRYYSYVDNTSGSITDAVTGTVKFTCTVDKNDNDIFTNTMTYSGFGDRFKKGDSLSITSPIAENNTHTVTSKYEQPGEDEILSCIVSKVNGDTLTVELYNRAGVKMKFTNYNQSGNSTVSRAMPDIVMACVANNRVFGVDNKGEMVYASKLGDFKNWNVFEGLSTDSWYGSVGTEGPFTGLATLGSNVVLFKHNYLHQIFGDNPQNFSIPKQLDIGCIDGDSIAVARNQLYFLSYDGIYVFSGGNPVKISEKLNRSYTTGYGGTDGARYYIIGKASVHTTRYETAVYDMARGLWHIEESTVGNTSGYLRYNDRLYMGIPAGANDAGLYEVHGGDVGIYTYGYKNWSVLSKWFDDSTTQKRGVNNIYIRLRMRPTSTAKIEVRTDDGEWKTTGNLTWKRITAAVVRVPVRFVSGTVYQFKITGTGDVTIEAFERVVYTGGRDER